MNQWRVIEINVNREPVETTKGVDPWSNEPPDFQRRFVPGPKVVTLTVERDGVSEKIGWTDELPELGSFISRGE